MGNERKKINLTDIDENSIVASFKEGRPADGQAQAAGNKGQSGEESGYVRLFIHESPVCARLGKTIYLRKEFHERIQRIVQTIGNNEMSIFSYVDNVLEQHFARLSGRDHEGIQKTKYRTVLTPGNHVSNLILTYR